MPFCNLSQTLNRPSLFKKTLGICLSGGILCGLLAGLPCSAETASPEAKSKKEAKPLAQTPPMGWNSFQSYSCYAHEEAVLKNLDVFIEKYKPLGYEYFVLDNGWFGEYELQPGTLFPAEKNAKKIHIDANGLVLPSKVYFPNGFDKIVKKCKANGIKLGVHMMRGIPQEAVRQNLKIKNSTYSARDVANPRSVSSWCHYTCGVDMKKPGAQDWYDALITHLSDLGVEFIKFDDIVTHPDEVEAVCNAIAKLKRPMTLSLSPGDRLLDTDEVWQKYEKANMIRVTADIWDNQGGIDRCFNKWKMWGHRSKPGFWIDMDMIPFGQLQVMCPKSKEYKYDGLGFTRKSQFSPAQKRTFITLRALSASPLMIGGDLPTMDAESEALLLNKDMICCNQNGVPAKLILEKDGIEVWRTQMRGNPNAGYTGVFNRSKKEQPVKLDAETLFGGQDFSAREVWTGMTLKPGEGVDSVLKARDAFFIRFDRK